MKLTPSSRRGLHDVADLLKPSNQAIGGFTGIGAIKVRGAQVVPFGAIAQHVPGGGEHGSGHADDGLLDATAGPQPMELRLQVAALDLHGCPGGLHQRGLEPLATPAQPGGAALAGTLVIARAQASPGQQMRRGWEARHVNADLGHDDVGADLAQAGHRAQQPGCGSKGLQAKAHLLLNARYGLVQRVDMVQVQLEHETVVRADASAQGFEQFRAAGFDAATDVRNQVLAAVRNRSNMVF